MNTIEHLSRIAEIYKERNAVYGDNYKHFGETLLGMFPQGLSLNTEEEFNRFALFLNVVHKVTRYARAINSGGHPDSLDDAAVYLMMLREVDDDCASL